MDKATSFRFYIYIYIKCSRLLSSFDNFDLSAHYFTLLISSWHRLWVYEDSQRQFKKYCHLLQKIYTIYSVKEITLFSNQSIEICIKGKDLRQHSERTREEHLKARSDRSESLCWGYLDLRGGAPGSAREEAEAGGRGGFVRGRRPVQGMIPGHPFLSPLEHVPLGRAATGPPACERPYRAGVHAC